MCARASRVDENPDVLSHDYAVVWHPDVRRLTQTSGKLFGHCQPRAARAKQHGTSRARFSCSVRPARRGTSATTARGKWLAPVATFNCLAGMLRVVLGLTYGHVTQLGTCQP